MSSTGIRAVVENTKGKEFPVRGRFWSDGTIMIANPRPERYPDYQFLVTYPSIYCEGDPKRLWWKPEDDDAEPSQLSPFKVKSMLLVLQKLKKR